MVTGTCNVCGEDKPIFYSSFSDSKDYKKNYCKQCYDYSKEKILCLDCDEQIAREDMVKHKSDMHTD
jgi:hypothetical protein